jgi:hypothetical protein
MAYVYGEQDAWYEAEDGDRVDLIPDKQRYEAGTSQACGSRCPSARPPSWWSSNTGRC